MTAPRRPNILFLITDQQRADHVGFGGDGTVHTPHLDALAARGSVFERAYVSNPICAPNRATIFTGMAPSAHGVRVNGIPLDWDARTWPRILREHGWRTAAVGKLHFQNMGWAEEELDGLPHSALEGDAWQRERPDGWDRFEDLARHRRERVEVPPDYYGFDAVDLVVGHSDWAGGHYFQWLRDHGIDPDAVRGPQRATVRYPGWDQVYRSALPEDRYPTAYVTERALARLGELAARPEPWLLVCSFPDPHHPFTPPGRFWDLHDARDMPLPATFDDDHEGSPPHLRAAVASRGRPDAFHTWAPTADQLRHALAAEYGMIAMIDEGVGRILGALEQTDAWQNTVVVFTSDHGDLFGDHGLMLKAFCHYRACATVPLVVAAPWLPAGRAGALVGSIDLAPTLLELAGCPGHHGLQGESLVPLMSGAVRAVRTELVIEEDHHDRPAGLPFAPRMRTVVTDRLRLTRYHPSRIGELYDLQEDPDERRNLHDHPESAALLAEGLEALATGMVRHDSTGIAPSASA